MRKDCDTARWQPDDPDMIRTLMALLTDLGRPGRRYRAALRRAWSTPTGSGENNAACNTGDDALLEMSVMIRNWAAGYPAPWLAPGENLRDWCDHGVKVVPADGPWPCPADGCRAEFEEASK